ncbi:DNA repair protein RadC [Gemmobacter caeruleus]|uniref:DNA repair protein RadC n=1 Tax=Gemmobacter caeruleus TaxID=2595004 RepID=UPI0011EF3D4C|nr:DNA repair protein RadC [Gemmobacter caeruleus]
MLDLPLPIHPTTGPRGFSPVFAVGDADPNHPFALTLSRRTPADLMSGQAAPLVLARFATLADAMLGAIDHAEGMATNTAPLLLAIFDRDERLVLAGAASDCAVAWCHPVMSATEARGVVTEASQLRAQAGRAAAWGEPDLAQRLRHRADLLDARLVDPLWRAFAARALQVAA